MSVLSNMTDADVQIIMGRHERAAQAALAAKLEMHEFDAYRGTASFSCEVGDDLYLIWDVDFSTNLEEGYEEDNPYPYTFWYRSLDTIYDYDHDRPIKVEIIGPDNESTVMLSPKFLHPDAVFSLIEEATMAHKEED